MEINIEKKLPIQLVKTRGTKDVFKKEGSSGDLPKWVTTETVRTNAQSMLITLREVSKIFDDKNRRLPVLLTATLNKKATAKTYRPNVRSVFDNKKKRNIIGIESPNELLIKVDNKTDLQLIQKNINSYSESTIKKDRLCGIAAVTGINKYKPEIDNDAVGHTVKIRLVDYLDQKWNTLSETIFIEQCDCYGIVAKKLNYTPDLRLFRVENITKENISSFATMDSVISVRKMPYIEISVSPEPYNTDIEVKLPVEGEDYPEVGLLDSGVASIPHLIPWLKGENQCIADLIPEDIDLRHGTAVAGVMLYGDELQGENYTNCSPMKITSCIVNTDDRRAKIDESECIEHIKESIRRNPSVKVWNLSQGSTDVILDNAFSDYAVTLDNIQKENKILICKSAGNKQYLNDDLRLTNGAESVRSLVIGSVAQVEINENDAKVGQRSPFSRIGPGPEFLTKPDLVHYGGNESKGIQSFSETGYQSSEYKGTSFSTPRVTALAANLAHRLKRDFDPCLIKALLVHSASYPNLEGMRDKDVLKELGHGVPSDIHSILNNDLNEFTMIWQPEFSIGEDFQIQDFPFPSGMVTDNGYYYGDITVTIVTDPILKVSEGSEYCQSNVDVLLQTYDSTNFVFLGAAGTPRTYRNAERLKNPKNILARDNYCKSSFNCYHSDERTLIEN